MTTVCLADFRVAACLMFNPPGMSRRALVLDGLWYTLCPSFNRVPRNPASFLGAEKRSTKLCPSRANGIAATLPRHYNSDARRIHNEEASKNDSTPIRSHDTPPLPSESRTTPEIPKHNVWSKDAEDENTLNLQRRQPRVPRSLEALSNSQLETMLRNVTTKAPNIRSTTQVLRTLIRDRRVRPTARHYKALILAHSDGERGSPEVVRELLEEMEKSGITADSGTLHAALQVCRRHETPRDNLLTYEPARSRFLLCIRTFCFARKFCANFEIGGSH